MPLDKLNKVQPIRQEHADKAIRMAKNIGLGALGIGAAYLIGRKVYRELRKKHSQSNYTDEAQQAVMLRSAMNRSGMSWFHWMDGTNTEALYKVAKEIKNFKRVAKEYRNLYNRVLVDDLRKELKAAELERFNALVNGASTLPDNLVQSGNAQNGSNTVNPMATKHFVFFDKPVKLYKSLTWYPMGAIKKVAAQSYIPYPVAGVKSIPLSVFKSVPFLVVKVRTQEGNEYPVFVPKSEVRLVRFEEIATQAAGFLPVEFHNRELE